MASQIRSHIEYLIQTYDILVLILYSKLMKKSCLAEYELMMIIDNGLLSVATVYVDEHGWVEYSRGSLNGSKYIVIDKSMTFYGAQDQCRKYGGYLAHINTIREQVFLEEFLLRELRLDGKLIRNTIPFAVVQELLENCYFSDL